MISVNRSPSRHRWQYQRLKRLLRPANRFSLDAFVTRAGHHLTGTVLNVGAGEDRRLFGSWTVRLDRYAPAVSVHADVTRSLPFRDATFDGLLCTEVLEHVPDPAGALREMARVLKPGGTAIVTVPFFFHYHADPEDYTRFTPTGLAVELERAGFEVEFLAGLGGKAIAALMLVESTGIASKLLIRTLLIPFRPWLARRGPVDKQWSDCASNVVAIARVPNRAHP